MTEPAQSFPMIPGIAVDALLMRLDSDGGLVAALLRRFAATPRDATEGFDRLLAAKRLVHSFASADLKACERLLLERLTPLVNRCRLRAALAILEGGNDG